MNIDEIALKLYKKVDVEKLVEAKKKGNVLEQFIEIAKEIFLNEDVKEKKRKTEDSVRIGEL